ncbi:MAG: inorganic phosphate transporter [Gammaproteobacteria bacterium]|jgi:PiT family inorganic phosphate transporter
MIILITVILFTLVFVYTNGFHDSANAIATVFATRTLSLRAALLYGASLNFLGAFFGIQVAKTIGISIAASASITQTVILCALLGAIIWNIITWFYGLPSSSSHALIGGLIGAAIMHASIHAINMHGIMHKVVIPMIISPILGIIITYIFTTVLLKITCNLCDKKLKKYFGKLQLISSGLMAFSHGANDTQKSMGIITIALIHFYALHSFNVPIWVILICATGMACGTMIGGWKIIKTMGRKIIKLKPMDGFAAETSAAGILLTASHFGIPVSTTHVISGSIIGAGSAKRFSAINWRLFSNIVFAWILTIPAAMILSGGLYFLLNKL